MEEKLYVRQTLCKIRKHERKGKKGKGRSLDMKYAREVRANTIAKLPTFRRESPSFLHLTFFHLGASHARFYLVEMMAARLPVETAILFGHESFSPDPQ